MKELYVSAFTDKSGSKRVIIYRSAETLREILGRDYATTANLIGTIGRSDLTDEAGSSVDALGYWSDTAAHFDRDYSPNFEARK